MAFVYQICLVFFLIVSLKLCSGLSEEPLECMIYNEEYKSEYLYALSGLNIARRSVYTWSPLVVKEFNANLPENCTNLFTDRDRQVSISLFSPIFKLWNVDKIFIKIWNHNKGVWIFEPVNGMNQTFYIRNQEYNEYLYATSLYSSFFTSRRKVFTWLYSVEPDDSFQWRLKPLETANKYELWNVKFDEPLYAASYFFRYDNLRMNVFTWNKKQPDSKQFNWFVKCRNHRSPSHREA